MNISEFAAFAGVSRSAVSRYFNDGYVSEEKRAIIEKAIAQTGYTPSVSAQNVRTRVTKLVGVILPKLSSESCSRVTEGIGEVLYRHGYQLLLVNTENDPAKEVEYLDLFRNNRVDAVIFLASVFTPNHRTVLRKMRVPVIIVGQEYKGLSCVSHDDYGAAYTLTKLMIERGCKRPACIHATELDKAAGLARKEGFLDALKDRHMEMPPARHILPAEFSIDSGYSRARQMFSKKPYPDALLCATDNMAAGALLYCREHGIGVPEDVMVCGIGDSKIGRITSVPLTTAHLHYKTSGIDAAEMLLSELKRGDNDIARNVKLAFSITERESTARKA